MIAVLSFFENWVPPLPADAAIALGAFISHGGTVSPIGVFLATWLPNVIGAMSVWAASRRYGRRFFASKLGHRLFSERALHFMELEYRRFGGLGLFIVRVLPGVRAVAAPFAGMADVSFIRALVPMAMASALWYGGLTFVGAWVGREWVQVRAWLLARGWPIGVAVLTLAVVLAVFLWRRRRPPGRTAEHLTSE